eukprot:Colp12_sorted_trinity150504_noHs@35763
MVFCHNCGTDCQVAKFCHGCGTKLRTPSEARAHAAAQEPAVSAQPAKRKAMFADEVEVPKPKIIRTTKAPEVAQAVVATKTSAAQTKVPEKKIESKMVSEGIFAGNATNTSVKERLQVKDEPKAAVSVKAKTNGAAKNSEPTVFSRLGSEAKPQAKSAVFDRLGKPSVEASAVKATKVRVRTTSESDVFSRLG